MLKQSSGLAVAAALPIAIAALLLVLLCEHPVRPFLVRAALVVCQMSDALCLPSRIVLDWLAQEDLMTVRKFTALAR